MIFLDTSVVLDLILLRKDKVILEELLQKLYQKEEEYGVCILTVHLVYYFAKKFGEDLNKVNDWFEAINILDLNEEDYLFVTANLNVEDMEDGLQIACSLRNNCQKVLTSDKKMQKKYDKFIPVEIFGV
jgi:predicted nucleic acid-binding protein